MLKLIGIAASPGAVVGHAWLVDRRRVQEPREHVDDARTELEVARLHEAIARSDAQLGDIRAQLGEQPAEHGLIIEAHRLMLADPAFVDAAANEIRNDRINAEWAVRRIVRTLKSAFDAIDDPYFQDRQNDIEFVGDRVVRNLLGEVNDIATDAIPPDAIVVAHDLSPADTMLLLANHTIAGIVTDEGGYTSHTAIVARAMEIPAVLGTERASEIIGQGDTLALDGATGLVVIHPSAEDTRAFEAARARHAERERRALETRELESKTRDGQRIALRANIELVEEVPSVISHGAEGVGLYRTEFLFLNKRELPTEEEHYETYKRLLFELAGRPVTVRTFDLGGEKNMGTQTREEANPALGLRAIRYCLAHPDMFLTQLRALWRASAHGPLRVMFPMVSGLNELRRAKALWEQARAEVVSAGHRTAPDIELGIMVETPAAAVLADRLAREVAFFSVGTNDLVQYTLAIDRGNPDVGYLHTPVHPAMLRLLEQVIQAGKAAGIPVSICGEMAGDPAYTLLLLGLGADELSMSGASVPAVKRIIRASTTEEGRALLSGATALDVANDVEGYVRGEMARRFPDECGPKKPIVPLDDPSLAVFSPS